MKPTRTLAAALAATAALALTLTACSSPAEPQPEAPDQSAEQPSPEAVWPRTIEIPAARGGEAAALTIEAEPQRIAALDYESAEVLAELGLADRLVLIPEAVLNPALGGHVEELSEVHATFPVAGEIEAENVISLQPDLVVMSPRHGNEAPIAEVLEQAGIAALQLPWSWISPDALAVNVDLIGQATGAEQQAAALSDEIGKGLAAAAAGSSPEADAPRVLVLTNQAGRPFITAGNAYPLVLLELAGAQNIADELGIDRTGPIGAEQIVHAAPDGIVLIDMNGTGDRMFAELLGSPAIAAVPAIAEDRVLRIEGRKVQALGLASTVDGLASLTEWVTSL